MSNSSNMANLLEQKLSTGRMPITCNSYKMEDLLEQKILQGVCP